MSIGKKRWVIAEGYLPPLGPNPDDRTLRSHEAACILNAGDQPAKVAITLYFTDREPLGPYRLEVPARRTLHVRYDDLDDEILDDDDDNVDIDEIADVGADDDEA